MAFESAMRRTDNLILRSLKGELSDVEARILRNWRQESPENERRYQRHQQLWSLDPPASPPGLPPGPPDIESIVGRSDARRKEAIPLWHRFLPASNRWIRRSAGVAALLLVGFALGGLWTDRPRRTFGAAELVTAANETATTTLTDGTVVRLAPNSRLRLTPDGESREVWLEGRAYFAVAPDSANPFTVHTRAGDALVLGTRFEVQVRHRELRLVVVEGRVALSADSEQVEVRAGEVSYARGGAGPTVIEVRHVRDLLNWPGGLLVFQSTPLEQVARELEHHFHTRVEITERAVASRVVTGWFTDETMERVVTAICRATSSRCVIEDERVIISP